jgi:small GTP-binding protein
MFVDANMSFHGRVVMIGDSDVGKTSILNQLVTHTFKAEEPQTIAANYQVYIDEVDGVSIEVQVWDTAGQERYRSLGPIYYRNASGAVLVYDVANRRTFENLPDWLLAFTEVAGPNSPVTVVANKIDLPEAAQQVPAAEGRQWATSKSCEFSLTSAKTGAGVKELFRNLARTVVRLRIAKNKPIAERTGGDRGCPC